MKVKPTSSTERILTVEQVSAGGVAYRLNGSAFEIAIICTAAENRWQLPKGIIDPGETAEQAAVREVREEAGLECKLIGPIDTIEYSFYGNYEGPTKRYHKKVHFFLMKYVAGNVADHDHEVTEATWVDIEKAPGILRFESEQAIINKAAVILESGKANTP